MEDAIVGLILLLPFAIWLGRRAVRLVVVSFYTMLGLMILLVLGLLFGGCASDDKWSSWQWMNHLNGKIEILADGLLSHLPKGETPKIAVLDFQDLDGKISEVGKMLSEEMTTILYQSKRVRVLERKLLKKAVEELEKNQSGRMAESEARRVGKLIGAEMIVVGTINEFISILRINARMIDVETGIIRSASSITLPYFMRVRGRGLYRLNH